MTDEQIHIIIQDEVGAEYPNDQRYYNKKCIAPSWPGGDSGVTIGIGYDLGFNSNEQIRADWQGKVGEDILNFIVSCAGIKGDAAKSKITAEVKKMRIPYQTAKDVFLNATLARFQSLANRTYPGLSQLNEVTQAVIVGLVYNRGASLTGERRKEMADLVPAVAAKDYERIAELIDQMKRLWVGTDVEDW